MGKTRLFVTNQQENDMTTMQIIETVIFTIAATLFVPMMALATLYFVY